MMHDYYAITPFTFLLIIFTDDIDAMPPLYLFALFSLRLFYAASHYLRHYIITFTHPAMILRR